MNNMFVIYSNVDSLTNKIHEISQRINLMNAKPHISLTEVKHKNKWDIDSAELSIDGYNKYDNNLDESHRGIINYVRKDLICKQITVGISCDECITIKLQVNNNCKLYLATIYRSPNSSVENDKAILEFIDTFGSRNVGYKLLLGDFNCPNIQWHTWEASGSFEISFLDTLRKNFLTQHVDKPT